MYVLHNGDIWASSEPIAQVPKIIIQSMTMGSLPYVRFLFFFPPSKFLLPPKYCFWIWAAHLNRDS